MGDIPLVSFLYMLITFQKKKVPNFVVPFLHGIRTKNSLVSLCDSNGRELIEEDKGKGVIR